MNKIIKAMMKSTIYMIIAMMMWGIIIHIFTMITYDQDIIQDIKEFNDMRIEAIENSNTGFVVFLYPTTMIIVLILIWLQGVWLGYNMEESGL